MAKPYKILLVVSYILTILLFWLDSIGEDGPYPVSEMITDFLLAGNMYTAIFFAIFSGIYYVSNLDFGRMFRRKT